MIWGKVTESDESGSWHFAQTLIIDENPVFDTEGDELACSRLGCRPKTIHAIGNVCKVSWLDLGGHPYTGIFNGGADYGYVRISSASPVDTKTPWSRPGMGVKFLRDGVDSANFVAMHDVDGQKSLNFFMNEWTAEIPQASNLLLKPLEIRFATASDYIETMGMSDMATYDAAG